MIENKMKRKQNKNQAVLTPEQIKWIDSAAYGYAPMFRRFVLTMQKWHPDIKITNQVQRDLSFGLVHDDIEIVCKLNNGWVALTCRVPTLHGYDDVHTFEIPIPKLNHKFRGSIDLMKAFDTKFRMMKAFEVALATSKNRQQLFDNRFARLVVDPITSKNMTVRYDGAGGVDLEGKLGMSIIGMFTPKQIEILNTAVKTIKDMPC